MIEDFSTQFSLLYFTSISTTAGNPVYCTLQLNDVSRYLTLYKKLQYIGCLEVYTSMKSLDFETRSCVAK